MKFIKTNVLVKHLIIEEEKELRYIEIVLLKVQAGKLYGQYLCASA